MRNLAIALGAAAILGIVVAGCAGGGAPATPTKPAATPAAAATPTKPAAVVTPAGAVSPAAAALGDANAGKALIVSKGCTSCHIVPGVPEAKGTVGPSLAGVASRPQIAGTLPNNAENLAKWLKNPPGAKPGTAMPNLGLSDKEVADLSAFLSTLK